jgi:hypothetical protein
MDSPAQPLKGLRAFRNSFYRCFDRRADALFELTDALLTAGTVPSPVHLSLAPVHRRGWGSLYAALSRGQVDEGSLRELLARRASVGDGDRSSVSTPWTSASGAVAMRRRVQDEGTTTIRLGTPPGSPSSQAGPTS